MQVIYDASWYKTSHNWMMKNLVGNWEFAPIYTYQSGTWGTAQSGADSNLNGDSGGDRASVNPAGNPNVGSGTTALTNSSGAVVAYLANNPNAGYVFTPKGVVATAGRNTLQFHPINDVDFSLVKRFNVTERYHLEFAARFFNVFNHPQYVGGNVSDVAPIGFTSTAVHNSLLPNQALFQQWSQVFSSNPRNVQLSAKFTF